MFTTDGALALSTVLQFANRVFSITIPGTNISFRSFYLSIIITCFIIVLARSFLGIIDMSVSKADRAHARSVRRERNSNREGD